MQFHQRKRIRLKCFNPYGSQIICSILTWEAPHFENFGTHKIIMFHKRCCQKAQSSSLNPSKRTIILFDSSSLQLFQSWTIRNNYSLSTEWNARGDLSFQTIGTFYHFLMKVITIIICLAKHWITECNRLKLKKRASFSIHKCQNIRFRRDMLIDKIGYFKIMYCAQGATDEVKRSEGPTARSRGRRAPRLLILNIVQVENSRLLSTLFKFWNFDDSSVSGQTWIENGKTRGEYRLIDREEYSMTPK